MGLKVDSIISLYKGWIYYAEILLCKENISYP